MKKMMTSYGWSAGVCWMNGFNRNKNGNGNKISQQNI